MKWIKTAKTIVSANRYGPHPSLDHNGRQSGARAVSRAFDQFGRRLLCARADDDFEHQRLWLGHKPDQPSVERWSDERLRRAPRPEDTSLQALVGWRAEPSLSAF